MGLKLTRGQLRYTVPRARSAAFGLRRSLQLLLSKQARHALITDLIKMATWAEEAPERCVYSCTVCTVQQTRSQVGNDKGEVPIASHPSGPNAILDMGMNINMDTVMDMVV